MKCKDSFYSKSTTLEFNKRCTKQTVIWFPATLFYIIISHKQMKVLTWWTSMTSKNFSNAWIHSWWFHTRGISTEITRYPWKFTEVMLHDLNMITGNNREEKEQNSKQEYLWQRTKKFNFHKKGQQPKQSNVLQLMNPFNY